YDGGIRIIPRRYSRYTFEEYSNEKACCTAYSFAGGGRGTIRHAADHATVFNGLAEFRANPSREFAHRQSGRSLHRKRAHEGLAQCGLDKTPAGEFVAVGMRQDDAMGKHRQPIAVLDQPFQGIQRIDLRLDVEFDAEPLGRTVEFTAQPVIAANE